MGQFDIFVTYVLMRLKAVQDTKNKEGEHKAINMLKYELLNLSSLANALEMVLATEITDNFDWEKAKENVQ